MSQVVNAVEGLFVEEHIAIGVGLDLRFCILPDESRGNMFSLQVSIDAVIAPRCTMVGKVISGYSRLD